MKADPLRAIIRPEISQYLMQSREFFILAALCTAFVGDDVAISWISPGGFHGVLQHVPGAHSRGPLLSDWLEGWPAHHRDAVYPAASANEYGPSVHVHSVPDVSRPYFPVIPGHVPLLSVILK